MRSFGALAFVSLIAIGCSSTTSGGQPADAGAVGDDGAVTLTFQPSNISVASVTGNASQALPEDVETSDCEIQTIAGTLGSGCLNSPITTTTEAFGTGQTQTVALIVVQSLKLGANSVLSVEGGLPLVIVSLGDVTLNTGSSIQANTVSDTDDVGPGGAESQGNSASQGLGLGGGVAGNLTTGVGGGGGSFCGLGGAGGGSTAAATPAYGTADVRPLQGGSSGGSGTGAPGGSGAGGGGIQIVALGSITVNANAYITAGGEGASSCISSACSAGGSGGAILLEAPTVSIAGIVAANGGAGGSNAAAGGDALPLSVGTAPTAAQGGAQGTNAAAGGNGSAGTVTAGQPSSGGSTTVIGGGGGGGAGWIRINTASGAATLTGATLSPAASTPCATQGTLRTIAEGP